MKIGSVIKHRDGSPRCVHVHGKPYEFKPLKDSDEVTHFVADVTDPAHAEVLMASEAFYAFDGKQRVPALKRVAPVATHTAGTGTKPPTLSDDQLAMATELLKGSAGDIGKAVGNATLDTVRAAIAVESASKTPRKTVIGLLQTALDGAIAAGVKG